MRGNLDPTSGHGQAGARPLLVVSNEVFNRRSGLATVLPPILKRESRPTTLPLECPFLFTFWRRKGAFFLLYDTVGRSGHYNERTMVHSVSHLSTLL
ncbi:type II toxin-antitoxin system PemK/MazF family toxin [bacterium]|nr:type II toxin-antitoxin system PemK/MazF family toxin [bacterium]